MNNASLDILARMIKDDAVDAYIMHAAVLSTHCDREFEAQTALKQRIAEDHNDFLAMSYGFSE